MTMNANHAEETFWRQRRVFVTGATGLLGGWVTAELHDRGAEVVALVRDHVPSCMLVADGMLAKINAVGGSVDDLKLLTRTIFEYEIETVFHLAAQSIVGVANKDPLSTLQTNVAGTWNVLEACRAGKVQQVIVASSDKAYGAQTQLPYSELHPMQGRHPYDVSKSCADLVSMMYAVSYRLPVCITRCANLYGGGDLNFSRVIPGAIRATLQGQPFVIRSDGRFVRDYLYIKDAVSAYLCLAERMAQKPEVAGEAFNISAGVRATAMEVTERVLELTGRRDLRPVVQNMATNEIRDQYLSRDKARIELGWTPAHDFRSALAETIEWYQQYRPWETKQARTTAIARGA